MARFNSTNNIAFSPQSLQMCFSDFTEIWFMEKQVEWRVSYRDTVRISLDKYILPHFGGKALTDVAKPDILEFRLYLSKQPGKGGNVTMSPSRINHIMTPLRMILNEAADRYGFMSPWQHIKSLKEGRTQVQPFSLGEVKKLIRSVRADYKPYLTTRFFTGMRTSEIDGLKWKYVDFDRRQILVREAWVQGRQVPTKTDGSVRDIEMASLVYEALKAQKTRTGGRGDYVFCSPSSNKPIANRNFVRRIWYPLLERQKLEPRRPYQTRHTAATLWLASGESPEWIARQMGHTTTEMLFRVYSRYVPNLTRQDGSAFERLLSSRFKTPLQADSQITEGCYV
nr:site-specific integrase [Kordiimonas pumila]